MNIFMSLSTQSKFPSKMQDVFWKYQFLFKTLNEKSLLNPHMSLHSWNKVFILTVSSGVCVTKADSLA